jgi:Na+/melibiose symporter-like transporter
VFVTAGVVTAMLFMGNPVYKVHGPPPNSANYTATASFLFFPTIILLCWYLAIRKFQRGYEADKSQDKDKFRSDWLSYINIAQWLCLFLITNTFMPVSVSAKA